VLSGSRSRSADLLSFLWVARDAAALPLMPADAVGMESLCLAAFAGWVVIPRVPLSF